MTYDIVVEKTVSVTGHRVLPKNFDKARVVFAFLGLIKKGYDTFLVGMALGFDTVCFEILEHLRLTYKIRIIACIPCINQAKTFSDSDKVKYVKMLDSADEIIYVTDKPYTNTCMMLRNIFMVDNSSILLAYCTKNKGGSYNTVKYALQKGKEVSYIE